MSEIRIDRTAETREVFQRPKAWAPAAGLPEPDKQPGYSYKWIRVASLGKDDGNNVSAKFREGWEPVRAEEQPKLRFVADRNTQFEGNIEVGGLLLCKIPAEFMKQRRAHYARINRSQAESVDNNFMRENDPRMPLFREKKSTSSFGKGK
jgi:hypothetical protein